MSLVNMVFNNKIDLSILGRPRTKDGCWSLDWQGIRVHVKPGMARFRFKDVTIKGLSRYGNGGPDHNFGTYTAHFNKFRWSDDTEVVTRLRVTGKSHPHLSTGVSELCWGNMGPARDYALERGDIETVAGLVREVLTHFYPGGAYGGWWYYNKGSDRECVSCGGKEIERNCILCQADICHDCLEGCKRGVYCPDCFKDRVREKLCIRCNHTTCKLHPDYIPDYVSSPPVYEQAHFDSVIDTTDGEWQTLVVDSGVNRTPEPLGLELDMRPRTGELDLDAEFHRMMDSADLAARPMNRMAELLRDIPDVMVADDT